MHEITLRTSILMSLLQEILYAAHFKRCCGKPSQERPASSERPEAPQPNAASKNLPALLTPLLGACDECIPTSPA